MSPHDPESSTAWTSFKRPRFFHGQLLSLSDFQLLLQYPRQRLHLIHRLIHGRGILCGLYPENPEMDAGDLCFELVPGAALDSLGREILVPESKRERIKGPFRNGRYFLHLVYEERESTPMPALERQTISRETCGYSRIAEGYRFELSEERPAMRDAVLEGEVVFQTRPSQGETGRRVPVGGARVQALRHDTVESAATTDEHGRFSLAVPAGDYVIQISGPGSDAATAVQHRSVRPRQRESLILELVEGEDGFDWFALKDRLARTPPRDMPTDAVGNDDPRVFLAVLEIEGKTVTVDTSETLRRRALILANPILQKLLLEHLDGRENPHRVTAGQIGALGSLNRVKPDRDPERDGNLSLVSNDGSLRIEALPEQAAVSLSLAGGTVRGRHLAEDLIVSTNQSLLIRREQSGVLDLAINPDMVEEFVRGRNIAADALVSRDHSLRIRRERGGNFNLELNPELPEGLIKGRHLDEKALVSKDGSIHVVRDRDGGLDLRLDPGLRPASPEPRAEPIRLEETLVSRDNSILLKPETGGRLSLELNPDLRQTREGDRFLTPDDLASSDQSLLFRKTGDGRLDARVNPALIVSPETKKPPEPSEGPRAITGLVSVTVSGLSVEETEWIGHPFGKKPVCVQLGVEGSWTETDDLEHPYDHGNFVVSGDLGAMPKYRRLFGGAKAPMMAAQVDILGERFKVFVSNPKLTQADLTVRWWVLDHLKDYGWKTDEDEDEEGEGWPNPRRA